tara:strand:- start:1355 stop:1630 length:276 start_codon:yes stop_codon:yes gene_type:complete
MELILLAVVPILASWLTELIKKLYSIRFSPNKKVILRSFAAVASFTGVFVASLAGGEPLSDMYIEEAVTSALLFLATQIPYAFGKKKAESV